MSAVFRAAKPATATLRGTNNAAVDDVALQAAINAMPVGGVLNLLGAFQSSAAKTLKPELTIRNGGGATITHTNAATNCFEYIPGGSLGFPGQIAIEGLSMRGPWLAGAQVLGTQTWANLKAAVFIDANAPFCRVFNCDIRDFYAQVLLRNCYHSRLSGYFAGGVHGGMLYGECHDTIFDNPICDFNLRTGLSVNYGSPAGKSALVQGIHTIGGAYQNCDVGLWIEATQGFAGTGTLYFEGNRIRDMQIGVGDSGAYLRGANFTRIEGIGTSSPVASPSVAPLYGRPQGANIEVSHSVNVKIQGAGFYSGTPNTTEHVIVDGYCDKTLVDVAFLASSAPFFFDLPNRVVTSNSGRVNSANIPVGYPKPMTYGTHGAAAPIGQGPYHADGFSGRPSVILEALANNSDLILRAKGGSGQIRFSDELGDEHFSVDPLNRTVNCYKPLRKRVYTVATLPAPSSSIAQGSCAFVSDAAAPVFGANVAGGGAVAVPVHVSAGVWKVG